MATIVAKPMSVQTESDAEANETDDIEDDSPDLRAKKLSKYEYILSQEFVDAFNSQIQKRPDGDCWQWMGGLHRQGFGRLRSGGLEFSSHRVAWELAHGPIPENRTVVHKEGVCNNRGCCNPEHYELGDPHDKRKRKRGGKGRIQLDPGFYDEEMMPSMFHVKHLDAYDGVKVFMDAEKKTEPAVDYLPHLDLIKKGLLSIIKRQEAHQKHIEALQTWKGTEAEATLCALTEKLDQLLERLAPTPVAVPIELTSKEKAISEATAAMDQAEGIEDVLEAVFRLAAATAGKSNQVPQSFDVAPLVWLNDESLKQSEGTEEATAMLNTWIQSYLSSLSDYDVVSPSMLLAHVRARFGKNLG